MKYLLALTLVLGIAGISGCGPDTSTTVLPPAAEEPPIVEKTEQPG